MQEIIKSLNQFVAEFNIPMGMKSRESKCQEEDAERSLAYQWGKPEFAGSEYKEESADRVITGILNLLALHVDPEQAIKDKIEATYAKYQARRDNENSDPR